MIITVLLLILLACRRISFFVVRTVKVQSLGNSEVYNTVLLTLITILCIRSPELTYDFNNQCLTKLFTEHIHSQPETFIGSGF